MANSPEKSLYVDFCRLLSAPHVTLQLVAACQDPLGTSEELLGIVLQDSGLCARILSTAVKICPETLDPAAPISSALIGLGRPTVRSLALEAGKTLIDTPLDGTQAKFLRKLWFDSQVAGSFCRSLADAIGYPAREEAHLCGLLLNLGMLILFSCDPKTYAEQAGSAFGPSRNGPKEHEDFVADQCRVATAMIDSWRLDSFLVEAIRFIDSAPLGCQEGALLVRIARLGAELCRTPLELTPAGKQLAARLLDLGADGLEVAFQQTAEHCRLLGPFDKSQNECSQELERTRRRLTSLVFSFAEQEGIRAQLAVAGDLNIMAATARSLYLRISPAREVVFFVPGADGKQFVGLSAPGQSRRISELTASVSGASLLAEALRSGNMQHSFDRADSPLSVFDLQLLALCRSPGVAVLPLRSGQAWQGAVVLGLDSVKDIPTLADPACYQLGWALAVGLASFAQREPAGKTGSQTDVLVRKIAHEIRTPLAIINNYTTAFKQLLDGSESVEVIDEVEKEVRRIGDILTYYTEPDKTTAGRGNDLPQPPDSLALSALNSLSETYFKNRNIEIVTDFDKQIAPLPVNAIAVRQILINLLKNAAEAILQEGRIVLSTSECLTSTGERQVLISVDDNGPGIDEVLLTRLFNPVATTKGDGHAGLGLHIVKELADDIGARIVCQSRFGQGTRFELRIPRPTDH